MFNLDIAVALAISLLFCLYAVSDKTFLCSTYNKYICAKKSCLPCLKAKFLRFSSKSTAISRFKLIKEEKALTLIELLFVLSILLMITSSLYSLLSSGEDVWDYGDKQITAQQNARSAMLRIQKETRSAYRLITDDPTNYPTGDYDLSLEGLQVIGETLSPNGSYTIYSSINYPWLSSAVPVVYRNTSIISSTEYTVNYVNGAINFTVAQLSTDIIKADYTYSAKVTYTLQSSTQLLTRRVNLGSLENIAKYVINKDKSPQVPVFTITSNLVEVMLIVDVDVNKKPVEYILNSNIRLRK
jgi:type II secretory pathway pseudopilin PulG